LSANLSFWYLGALRHMDRDRTFLLHDLRGHGASSMPEQGYKLAQMAEDFRLMLDRLGILRTHVVGHSHGARVALVFALKYPERVESLTIADTQIRALQPPMRLGDWPHWATWKADLVARGVKQFPSEDSLIDFRLLAALGPRNAGADEEESARPRITAHPGISSVARIEPSRDGRRIDLHSRQMGQRGAQQWQTLIETTNASEEMQDESDIATEQLSKLTMPTLLMYGQLSHCVATSDRLREIVPGSRRIMVPGGGHFFPIVKPRLFARALGKFLAQVDPVVERPVAALKESPAPISVAARLEKNRLEQIGTLGPALTARSTAQLTRRGG